MFERSEPVIVAGARTPIGRFGGALAPLRATELGGLAIAAALRRARVEPGQVEHVLIGHVLQAGQGQITARQAAVGAGVPMTVPALTLNKVCLSGLAAIAGAAQYVELGQAGLLVAGGMESMSNAPYLIPDARFGARMGRPGGEDRAGGGAAAPRRAAPGRRRRGDPAWHHRGGAGRAAPGVLGR